MKLNFAFTAFICLAISFSSCNSDEKKTISTDGIENPMSASGDESGEKLPVLTFEKENHDFGKIYQGEKVSYSFKFTNTGKADLLISSAKASCGCTVPNYPKEPIAPGKGGKIDVLFDSDGKSGMITKTVSVLANTVPNAMVLTINGEIIVPVQK